MFRVLFLMIALLAGLIAGPYSPVSKVMSELKRQTPYMKCHSPH